jgi:hypothetical protein
MFLFNRRREAFESFVTHSLERIMTKQDQLNALLTQVTTDFGTFVTAVQAEVTVLQNVITTDQPIDLTSALTSLTNLDTAVKAAQAALPTLPAGSVSTSSAPAAG